MIAIHPRLPISLLALLALLAGCAGSDGGPIGTGITASVVGNVAAVVEGPAENGETVEAAASSLGQVDVSIDEIPGIQTQTDDEGNFALEGDFAGELTLRFRRGSTDGAARIEVPAGSVLVVSDVTLAPGDAQAEGGHQTGFVGRLAAVDCAGLRLEIEEIGGASTRRFEVLLLEETRLTSADGAVISCSALRSGERASVDGSFSADAPATLVALSISVGKERPDRPEVLEDVPFVGFVTQLDCPAGRLIASDDRRRTRVDITAATEIVRRDGASLACEQISVGDRIAGLGRLRVRRPNAIEATQMVVRQEAPIDARVRLSGVVVGTDCGDAVLQIGDAGAVAAIRITPGTSLEPPVACEDIQLGTRVRGVGRVREDGSPIIDAVRLEFLRPARER